ncbi:MAG: sodium:proline symporter [Haloglomus sp.]
MVSTAVALGATVVTLAVFAAIGVRYSGGDRGIESFISARGSVGSYRLGATVLASSMGAWILFSPPEAGAAFGGIAAVAGYAVGSAVALLAYVKLGPRIRELIPEGHSLTEYAYVRYGPAAYAYVLAVSVAYMFVFLAAEFTGIAGALSLIADVPAWQTAALIGGFVLLYTGYGGLRASIVTDTIQTAVLLPLIAVGFVGAVVALGGPVHLVRETTATNPQLLDPTFLPGVQFGVYVVVAIAGAELVNQAWWQRVYAAADDAAVRRGFGLGAALVVPMVLFSGLFGVAAAGLGALEQGEASIAFFVLLQQSFPEWVVLVVVLVAVLLVTSSADTLFNAIASLVTSDLPRLLDDPSDERLTAAARGLTGVVALAATVVGAQEYSVLAIFLTADLLAAATFGPLLAGLYTPRLSGGAMLGSSVAGLLVGLTFFPTARGVLAGLPGASALPTPSFLYAFLGAAAVSVGLAALATRVAPADYDLDRLSTEIRTLDGGDQSADAAPADD